MASCVGMLASGAVVATVWLGGPALAHADEEGSIRGTVVTDKTNDPIPEATVLLQCACIEGERITRTNATGIYRFDGLPAGTYTVQVILANGSVSKIVTLTRGAQLRAGFAMDPNLGRNVVVVVQQPVKRVPGAARTFRPGETTALPAGQSPDGGYGGSLALIPTGGTGADGQVTINAQPEPDHGFTLDNAQSANPINGRMSSSTVQEFVDEIEVLEADYDAEYGGASGAQVRARRVSGSDTHRGQAVFRVTPRLAPPRFITRTDEALRTLETPDFGLQGVVVVSGPLVKGKLYYSAGISPQGGQRTLYQQFYARVDRDASGGYEECPFENGDNDCAPGQRYIQTKKFAEQTFKLKTMNIGYLFGLNWNITTRHQLALTVEGGPSVNQRSFRLPYSTDPNSFGTNPTSDPLGGLSRVGSGVVNNSFGWDAAFRNLVILNYFGRVAKDKIEIDAGVSYGVFSTTEGWRLDDESLRRTPTTQQ